MLFIQSCCLVKNLSRKNTTGTALPWGLPEAVQKGGLKESIIIIIIMHSSARKDPGTGDWKGHEPGK